MEDEELNNPQEEVAASELQGRNVVAVSEVATEDDGA
jgi:hypothetical protein